MSQNYVTDVLFIPQQLVIPLLVVRMACLMFTVLSVYVMMDTLGLTVQWILMNVHQLNHLVMVVVYAQTQSEALSAHVQTLARLIITVLVVVIAPVKREERAPATIQLHFYVPAHQGLLE